LEEAPLPTGLFRSPLARGMPARVPPPFFFIGLQKEVNMLALLIDREAGKRTVGEGEEGFLGRSVRHASRTYPSSKTEGSMHNATVKFFFFGSLKLADCCDR
jgi:hypothetical protein